MICSFKNLMYFVLVHLFLNLSCSDRAKVRTSKPEPAKTCQGSDCEGVDTVADSDSQDSSDQADPSGLLDPEPECSYISVSNSGSDRVKLRSGPALTEAEVGYLNPGAIAKVLDVEEQGDEVVHDVDASNKSTVWYAIEQAAVSPAWITAVFVECIEEPPSVDGASNISTDWLWPVTGKKTLDDNWKVSHPFGRQLGSWQGHLGADYGRGANLGKPIYAIADGEVAYVQPAAGNWLSFPVVKHVLEKPTSLGDTIVYSRYGHVKATPNLNVGQKVRAGEKIGTIEDNGDFGPHLHLEISNQEGFDKMTPGSGYTKEFNFEGRSFIEHQGGRFYNPHEFISKGGKL